MIKFTALIHHEKNSISWYFIIVPQELAIQLHSTDKKSFKVKGKIDELKVNGLSLLPAGGGDYLLAIHSAIRKAIQKNPGDSIALQLEKDTDPFIFPEDIMECLNDEPDAIGYFNTLAISHRKYFIKWIDTAKTIATRSKRIAQMLHALSNKMGFPEMLRYHKSMKEE